MPLYFKGKRVGISHTTEDYKTIRGIVDGNLIEYDNTKVGATTIKPYAFYKCSKLSKANYMGTTNIGQYSNYNNTGLTELVLDPNITFIEQYAFYNCPLTNTDIVLSAPCKLGMDAFYMHNLRSITGYFTEYINIYAFYGKSGNTTQSLNIRIDGIAGQQCFYNLSKVTNFKFDKNSLLDGHVESSAFANLGSTRPDQENNILEFDLSNTAIGTIKSGAFASQYYFKTTLPETVVALENTSFGTFKNSVLYFNSITPPTITTTTFKSISNSKICVPYNSLNAYKTATNWVDITDYVIGFTKADVFENNQNLPTYSTEGYPLTWYKDTALTDIITVPQANAEYYYCTIDTTEQKEVITVTSPLIKNCTVHITDVDTGYEHTLNEGILIGTNLQITVTPFENNTVPYILTINKIPVENTYTFTATPGENLDIVSVFYDGVNPPVDPEFAKNDWVIIKKVIQDGDADKYWQVGDTKPTKFNGGTNSVRIADLQKGRYDYADGTRTTNAVLEFVAATPPVDTPSEGDKTNAGGWAECRLRTTLNTTLLNTLHPNLKNLLEEVMVKSANGGGNNYTEVTSSSNKLFAPCLREIDPTAYQNTPSYRDRLNAEGSVFDYYNVTNSTELNTRRKKILKGNYVNARWDNYTWWLRTPVMSNTNSWCYMESSGSYSTATGHNTGRAYGACFAW